MKMYSLAILLTLIGVSLAVPVHHHEIVSTPIYEDRVNRTIECIRTLFNKGKPEIGLPSYDPLVLPDINLNLSEMFGSSQLRGTIALEGMKFSNVMRFTVSHIEATKIRNSEEFKLRIVGEWPDYSFETKYDIDAIIKGNTVKGKGSFRFAFTNLGFDTTFHTVLPLNPDEFSIKISAGALDYHVDDLTIKGENITDRINKSASKSAEIWKQNSDVINKSVTEKMLKKINDAYFDNRIKQEVVAEYTKCWNDSE